MEHFEGLLERLGKHGEMRTSVVLSTQYEGRPVEAPAEDFMLLAPVMPPWLR
jgi:Lrp/AsnC family leucine-responsive transcriptional regulator